MEPTKDQKPFRLPTKISNKFLFIVCLVDSIALVWLTTYIWLHGSTPESIQGMEILGAIWGGTAASLIGPIWKAAKQWPASYHKFITFGVLITGAVAGGYIWVRAGHTAKLEMLFKEDQELERSAAPKKQRFMQLTRENPKSLGEYLQRCAELEPAINDYEAAERQGDNLLSQMQQEIGELKPQASYGSLLAGFTVLRAVSAKDIEAEEAYRREIEYAKRLPDIPGAERAQFYNANIQPIVEQERKIALDEIEILKDAKRRSITLPKSVYEGAGIK
jgi:hypothetical protein